MLVYAGHIVSIFMFLIVSVTSVYMLTTVKHINLPQCYLWMPRMVVVIMLLHSSMFFVVQADYLLREHGIDPVSDPGGPARILYSIFHGFALVCFATGMNIFFRWRRKMFFDKDRCPRRRLDDPRRIQ